MSLANWMSQLPPVLTCRPIYTLKIPGSHDSGATNFLNDKLPVANDEDGPIQQLGKAFCIRRGIKRWAVCQSCSIRDQLDHGIRYLDLRVSNPPVGVRKSKTDFRLIHALYGPKLHNVFREILDFLTVNTKEVILLDMNHLYDFDLESYCILQTLAMDILGQDLFCPVMNPDDVSLDFMWQNGYKVIAFSSLASCDCPVIWPGCLIPSPWPNTNNVDELIQILESQLDDCRKNSRGFYVTQGILTPRSYDVVAKWFSTLRAQFAERATDRVLSWLDELEEEKREMLNVVILDFIDDASSRKIISLNADSILAPTQTQPCSNSSLQFSADSILAPTQSQPYCNASLQYSADAILAPTQSQPCSKASPQFSADSILAPTQSQTYSITSLQYSADADLAPAQSQPHSIASLQYSADADLAPAQSQPYSIASLQYSEQ